MRLLLDTHSLLWWVEGAPQLSTHAEATIASGESVCYVSTASAWEMAIKASQGKLRLSLSIHQYFLDHLPANDFQQLDMTLSHVTVVETLPFHHRDPFDRLLVAQCLVDGFSIVSADKIFDQYGVQRIW